MLSALESDECKYRNIFGWRKHFISMLQELETWFPRVVIVRHEDIMCPGGAVQFVKKLMLNYKLCYSGKEVNEESIKFEFHRGEARSKGKRATCESLKRASAYINPTAALHLSTRCRVLNRLVDWSSETQYSPTCNGSTVKDFL